MKKTLVLFPSILLIIQFTFSFNQRLFMHIIQSTRTKKMFCWCYTKHTRKLLSVSLKASVNRRNKPLNNRCFDFTDEFKHSELCHFTLQTSIQHKKLKKKKQIFFCETVFMPKLNLKMEVSWPCNQVCFNLVPRVSHLWGSKMRDAGNEVGYVFPVSQTESQSPGTEHCCSTALMIPNSNFILKTIFWRPTQV